MQGVVGSQGLLLEHPRGAVLELDAGDLPTGTSVRLAAVQATERDLVAGLQPDGVVWSIEADSQPLGPVSFSIPFTPESVAGDAVPYVATYDELTELWLPGETTVDGNWLHTELASFSLKTWIVDRHQTATGWVSWLEYQLFKVLGSRASEPDCSDSPAPDWVRDVITVDDLNTQLFGCVRAHGDGFAIEVTNNRGYPVDLELSVPFTAAEPGRVQADVQGLRSLITHLVTVTGGQRIPLAPLESAAVVYAPVASEHGIVTGHVRRDVTSMLAFLVIEVSSRAGVDLPLPGGQSLGLWSLECFGKAYNTTRDAIDGDMVSAGNQLIGCLTSTLEHEVRAWGVEPGSLGLWGPTGRHPAGVSRMIAALRVLRALEVTRWTSIVADYMVNDATPEADLVDISVRWTDAPMWSLPSGPDSDWTGTWTGDVDQQGAGHYSVRVTFQRVGGEYAAEVIYPELSCSGTWSQTDRSGDTVTFLENITQGLPRCVEEVEIRIAPKADGTLEYSFDNPTGTARLRRSTEVAADWPTGRNDSVPGLLTWLGATAAAPGTPVVDFPDWVACDSARTWCLLGGSRHHTLVETTPGFLVLGQIDPFVSDPASALTGYGVSARAAEEILAGPGGGGGGGGW
ncbi:hypothetical protein MWU75_07520 [Ornithinimicrobium sp. F0845]|nr:hypothetical protein [Ornithinimicrobium sp. F0845]